MTYIVFNRNSNRRVCGKIRNSTDWLLLLNFLLLCNLGQDDVFGFYLWPNGDL